MEFSVLSSDMFLSFVLLILTVDNAFAFPSMLSESFINRRHVEQASADSPCPRINEMAKRQAPGITPPFDASQQYVSNAGAHAFVAPGPNDQRGPCEL